MKHIFPLIVILILLQGCVVIPTYTSRISLNETKCSDPNAQIHNVLLIGTGPIASRVFLENLSAIMIQRLKKKGVNAEFSYIGKLTASSSRKLDSVVNNRFDSYLLFKASDSSYLDMTKTKSVIIGPVISGSYIGNQYSEKYKLQLFQKKERMHLVWDGKLNIDFDLANNSRYEYISNVIFKGLSKDLVQLK